MNWYLAAALVLVGLSGWIVVTAGRLRAWARRAEAPATWWDETRRQRVLVHTRDNQTFDGQLVRVDADGVVLDPVTLVDGPHRLKGRVFLPADRIAWWQHPQEDWRPEDDV